MNESAKTMLFILGAMKWFADNGYADHSNGPLTDAGVAAFDQLEAEGFRPPPATTTDAVEVLRKRGIIHCSPKDADALVTLINGWDQIKTMRGDRP